MAKSEAGDIASRLSQALTTTDLTQSELAKRLDVTPGAVSGWFGGSKTPSKANIAAAAGVLGVEPEWLQYGTGVGPQGDLAHLRVEYRSACGWKFRPAPRDGGRDYGNANVWAFDPTISVMVRDIIQNCRDAVAPGASQVNVTFKVIRLKGKHLSEFLDSIAWSQLRPHLEASGTIDQRLGRLIKHNLDRLDAEREMLLLVVEDSGTIGLIGEEDGEGNFAALVRNNLDSNKQTGSAGGAFGLGKAVLWRMSAYSLVLFSSNLSTPTADGLSRRRVMGRCDLPWHECNSSPHAGPGWFGRVDGDRTVSYWDNAALMDDLFMSRQETVGTSVAIVGFHDPSSPESRTPADLAKEIRAAVADWFWPDLAIGRLVVNVDVYEGHERKSGGEVAADEYREEFVDAITKWKNEDELVERFSKSGDVVCVTVPLCYPKRRASPEHPAGEHDAFLLVRFAGEMDGDSEASERRLNQMAMFRGVGMVVEYKDLRGICMGALPFHAALLCGEAVARPGDEPQSSDKEAERFLRIAEPPSHNKWTSTSDLSAEYHRPTKKAIDDLIESAKKRIREIVRPATEDLSDGPNAIKELLKIGDDSEPPPERPRVFRPTGAVHDDGSWSISARIRVKPSSAAWKVQPLIVFEQETGAGQVVQWRKLTAVSNCMEDTGHTLVIAPNVREAVFEGVSDPDSHPIDARESSITIDLRNCKRQEGGES